MTQSIVKPLSPVSGQVSVKPLAPSNTFVVKGSSTTRGPAGPVGPAGPAGAPGESLLSLSVQEGDVVPDPGDQKIAWSTATNSLMGYLGGAWRSLSPGISVGTVPPSSPILNQIWIDTN